MRDPPPEAPPVRRLPSRACPPARPSVLVVDGTLASRTGLSRLLESLGYECRVASDGREAWEMLQSKPAAIVITDWMMPRMTGLELCERIRAAGLERYVYVIIHTEREASEDVVAALEAVADDFLTKPLCHAELRARLHAAERLLALEGRLAHDNEELEVANRRLEEASEVTSRDLRAAALLQRGLLPQAVPAMNGVRFEWLFRPSLAVGGDLLSVSPLDPSLVRFYLLDVAGHGVAAAMHAMKIHHALMPDGPRGGRLRPPEGARASRGLPAAAEFARVLNEEFLTEDAPAAHFTLVYGLLDVAERVLAFVQAGHPSPLLVRAGLARPVGHGGHPIGLLPDLTWETVQVQLEPGDRIVLPSDGVNECPSPLGEGFGESRLSAFLEARRGEPLARVVEQLGSELSSWHGSSELPDDVSLLAFDLPEES